MPTRRRRLHYRLWDCYSVLSPLVAGLDVVDPAPLVQTCPRLAGCGLAHASGPLCAPSKPGGELAASELSTSVPSLLDRWLCTLRLGCTRLLGSACVVAAASDGGRCCWTRQSVKPRDKQQSTDHCYESASKERVSDGVGTTGVRHQPQDTKAGLQRATRVGVSERESANDAAATTPPMISAIVPRITCTRARVNSSASLVNGSSTSITSPCMCG